MNGALRRALQRAGSVEAEAVTRHALQHAAVSLARHLRLPVDALDESRLGRPKADEPEVESGVDQFLRESLSEDHAEGLHEGRRCAHSMGELLDGLLALRMQLADGGNHGRASIRRSSGSFFTPASLCAVVARHALAPWLTPRATSWTGPASRVSSRARITICDPAVGGGAFLIECCAALSEAYCADGLDPREARIRAGMGLHGVDRSELAIAVAEVALWLYANDQELTPSWSRARFLRGDALCGALWQPAPSQAPDDAVALDWHVAYPELAASGFDLVIGNPPWVAFAGRSAQPLTAAWRDYYRRRFEAFAGFPTLHGLFVERAAALAPHGRVALLLPSAVADLDGYRSARRALTRTHRVDVPLTEMGQDAFQGVVQPSFVLVADAAQGDNVPLEQTVRGVAAGGTSAEVPDRGGSTSVWTLAERARRSTELVFAEPPPVLARLAERTLLPPATFRELGFQSNREVSSRLFLRGTEPRGPFRVPLLEGRNVREFAQDPARLFLWGDPVELKKARCRLRPGAEYEAVAFVVRQTASVTIAARHGGGAFRNSLLAGYALGDLDADLLVATLNSALFRALHVARQRDARQATFPQVKIGHLRRLPAPPADPALRERVRRIGQEATSRGACPPALRSELDGAVADLFGLSAPERESVERYLIDRLAAGRRAGNTAPASEKRPPEGATATVEGGFVEPRGIEPLTS